MPGVRFAVALVCGCAAASVALAQPFPDLGAIPDEPREHGLPLFVGVPASRKPWPPKDVVPHALLAPQASIHIDAYNSDATDLATPLGLDPVVTSRRYGESLVGTCLNLVFDHAGRLFASCGVVLDSGNIAFQLTLLDPDTLEKRASFTLFEFTLAELLGAPVDLGYMVFDQAGRFIAIDRENKVLWVGLRDQSEDGPLEVLESRDLSSYVHPARDKIASVVPDYQGRLYYLALGKKDDQGDAIVPALVGVVEPISGAHAQRELTGEIVENGLAVGPDGVFVLSDRAQYGFTFEAATGSLRELFRQPYTRATVHKPGTLSRGSGSTPTLIGEHLLAITDNADEQIHLVVMDRSETPAGPRVLCEVPLFDKGQSANENSVVVLGRSIFIQNWYGAPESFLAGDHRSIVPGLMRVDVRPDESGCEVKWHTRELATPATLKASSATGLLYGAMLDRGTAAFNAFYGVTIDMENGEIVNRVRLGVGPAADIQLSPTYIGPDGAIYQPVRLGLIKWRDGRIEQPDAGHGDLADAGGTESATESARGEREGCSLVPARMAHGGAVRAIFAINLCAALCRSRRRRHGPDSRSRSAGVRQPIATRASAVRSKQA